jgi:hypothetical protein
METIQLNHKILTDEILTILSEMFSSQITKSELQDLEITLSYEDDYLEVGIEGVSDNIFLTSENDSLPEHKGFLLSDYFHSLLKIHQNFSFSIDLSTSEIEFFLHLKVQDIDSELFDSEFSDYYSFGKYSDLYFFEFDSNSGFYMTYDSSFSFGVYDNQISHHDSLYNYVKLCYDRREVVSYDDYIQELYADDIRYFTSEIQSYTISDYFDDEYAMVSLRERQYYNGVFPDYDEVGEGLTDYYSELIEELYTKELITSNQKRALFNLDEDEYHSLLAEIINRCDVELADRYTQSSQKFMMTADILTTIYVDRMKILNWINDYNTYSWLNRSLFYEILLGTVFDNHQFIDCFYSEKDYYADVTIDITYFVRFSDVVEVIENFDLKLGFISDDNSVWEEDDDGDE